LGELGRLQSKRDDQTAAPVSELTAAELDRELARLGALARPDGGVSVKRSRKRTRAGVHPLL